MIRPQGSWVALITPYTPDNRIDFDGFNILVDFHIDQGTNGLILCGSTGEPTLLTMEEKREIYERVLAHAKGKIPVMVGTTCGNVADTISQSQYAEKVYADGVLLVAPSYIRPPQEALYKYFKIVAESVNLPIAIYNNPTRVGVNIDSQTIIRLSKIPNVVAIKQAMPDIAQLDEIMRLARDEINLLCCDYPGYGLILPTLGLGGHGTANVAGNIIPQEMSAMSQPWENINDVQRTRELYFKYLPLIKALYSVTNPVPVKSALELLGLHSSHCRPPLPHMDARKMEQLHKLMIHLGVIKKYKRRM